MHKWSSWNHFFYWFDLLNSFNKLQSVTNGGNICDSVKICSLKDIRLINNIQCTSYPCVIMPLCAARNECIHVFVPDN